MTEMLWSFLRILETFMPKLDEFEAKITAKTKAIIINNPEQPDGCYCMM